MHIALLHAPHTGSKVLEGTLKRWWREKREQRKKQFRKDSIFFFFGREKRNEDEEIVICLSIGDLLLLFIYSDCFAIDLNALLSEWIRAGQKESEIRYIEKWELEIRPTNGE